MKYLYEDRLLRTQNKIEMHLEVFLDYTSIPLFGFQGEEQTTVA